MNSGKSLIYSRRGMTRIGMRGKAFSAGTIAVVNAL